MKPTYQELEGKLAQTEARLEQTHQLLKLALERIASLEERLNKNSKNSSKPPSLDQKSNSQKKNTRRKDRGKGVNRNAFPPERIDQHVSCSLDQCPDCGSSQLVDLDTPLILQQVDLPHVQAIVTQFNLNKHRCNCCGNSSFADLPMGTPNSAFGPRMMALIATLTGGLHLAKRDAMQLIRDLYGTEICEGSIINIEQRVATVLDEVYDRIHRHVTQSALCKHFDETRWRDCGKSHYVWVASTTAATCFGIDASRSREAFERFVGVLSRVLVVTDRYGVYSHLESPHQYCLEHLIRDFRKYAERDGPDHEIGTALEQGLRQVCKTHRKFRNGLISLRSRNMRFRHQKRCLEGDLLEGLANGSDGLAGLCERLLDHFPKLWTFSDFIDVDPTNNLAERDLRRVVLWRKKSYGTRSDRGKRFVERISSLVGTLKKSRIGIFNYIEQAVRAFYQGQSAPLINPGLGY